LSRKYLGHPLINQTELIRLDLDSYEEFDTSRILLQQPKYNQPLDFRPGQRQVEDSHINIPEQPLATPMAGQMQPGGGNGGKAV
jgi:hypothetical protein